MLRSSPDLLMMYVEGHHGFQKALERVLLGIDTTVFHGVCDILYFGQYGLGYDTYLRIGKVSAFPNRDRSASDDKYLCPADIGEKCCVSASPDRFDLVGTMVHLTHVRFGTLPFNSWGIAPTVNNNLN